MTDKKKLEIGDIVVYRYKAKDIPTEIFVKAKVNAIDRRYAYCETVNGSYIEIVLERIPKDNINGFGYFQMDAGGCTWQLCTAEIEEEYQTFKERMKIINRFFDITTQCSFDTMKTILNLFDNND